MITININDVSNENPAALAALGNYLLRVAGVPTVESVPPLVVVPPAHVTAPVADAPDVPPIPQEGESVPNPPATVPDAPVPPVPAEGVEVDAHGLPWDSRIHSETKNRNGDGSWRNRRNLDKTILATVEAELRSVMSAGVPPVPQEGGPVPNDVPLVPNDAPDVPTTLPPTDAPAADTFGAFMAYVTPLMTSGKITTAQLIEIVKAQGLPHVGALSKRPDLIDAVRAAVAGVVA